VSDFFVEFEIASEGRYRQLVMVVEALRQAKQSDEWRDDGYWLAFFDQEARSHFWWPTPAEEQEWQRRWFSTPVPERFTDPSLEHPWAFDGMIDAFRDGEYDLLGCRKVSDGVGRLEFAPHAWPYGGPDCMEALIEAFGHRVTRVEG
jgi:hypothetical protein